ncbi:hypothetical protein C9374_001112 [Naegleria lovaniensis]|uniref:Uncharacterized protein n=1 Tax=Naegleria lovaniensis TaxID=51637 RepID=A0AA88KMF6_NAELO|nr:uncharacterized protein C9374_001112 [Naegleria lovaniensis]KAG2387518.1 hypothetical protein C9374_001112 [Naegleria lovaniensis]
MGRRKQKSLTASRNRFRTKENSHFAMIESIDTHFDEMECYFACREASGSKFYELSVIGVIFVNSKGPIHKLGRLTGTVQTPKYILSCDLSRKAPPNNRPSHLLIVLMQKSKGEWDQYSSSRFGLLKLGTLGFEFNYPNPERIFLFAEPEFGGYANDENYYITQWDEQKAEIFRASKDSAASVVFQINQNSINHSSLRLESFCYTPVYGITERHVAQVVEKTHAYYLIFQQEIHSMIIEVCRMTFGSPMEYDLPTVKVVHTVEGARDGYYECFEMEGMDSTKEVYVLSYGVGRSKSSENCNVLTSGIFKLNEENEVSEFSKIDVANFEEVFQHNMKILSTCKLVNGKYLIMGRMIKDDLDESDNNVPTFDRLFAKEIIWIVLDLNLKTVKRVFPREDPIASSSSSTNHEKRSKKQKKTSNQPQFLFIQDGDLNGGFANPFPRNSSKNQLSDNLNYISEDKRFKKYDLQIPKPTILDSNLTLCSIRPFPSNPDLFQIMLNFKRRQAVYYSNECHGQLFRFYFRMREECSPCFIEKPLQFYDIQFKSHV